MIKIKSATGFSDDELKKLQGGVDLANKTIVDARFKAKVLAHLKLDGTSGYENTDDSCEQVWDNIKSKMIDSDLEIDFSIYTTAWYDRADDIVIGYEDEDGEHLNRKFFSEFTEADLVDTIIHESGHAIDYTHDFESTNIRPYSEPYGTGYEAEEVADEIVGKDSPDNSGEDPEPEDSESPITVKPGTESEAIKQEVISDASAEASQVGPSSPAPISEP